MAGKPAPSSNEPLCEWHQAPVTLIYQWKIKEGMVGGGGGGGGEESTIQRLNKASGFHESIVYHYKAHGADASRADCACTTTLTAEF